MLEAIDKLGQEITKEMYENGLIETWMNNKAHSGGWKLVSGIWSPFYLQMRKITSYPKLLSKVGKFLSMVIGEYCPKFDALVGIAMAGIPIATSTSIHSNIPSCYTRKIEGLKKLDEFQEKIQSYGGHSLIEGILKDGYNVALVDDLVTKFTTKMIAVKLLEYETRQRSIEVDCKSVIVLFDREQGAVEEAQKHGVKLYSGIPFKSKGLMWLKGVWSDLEGEVVREYLENPDKYQKEDKQLELREIAEKNK